MPKPKCSNSKSRPAWHAHLDCRPLPVLLFLSLSLCLLLSVGFFGFGTQSADSCAGTQSYWDWSVQRGTSWFAHKCSSNIALGHEMRLPLVYDHDMLMLQTSTENSDENLNKTERRCLLEQNLMADFSMMPIWYGMRLENVEGALLFTCNGDWV